jgi:hypothetical protein
MSILLVTTQIAGIILLIATMVLLFFRRIYLDAETKQPIKFSLPVIGEVSTQAPVLVLVLVAAFMVVYPLSRMGPEKAVVEGEIDTGGKSVTVLIVADPDYVHSQDASGKFSVRIPLLATDATYRIKYVVDKLIIADQFATLKNGRIELSSVRWVAPVEDGAIGRIPVKKEVSDEEIAKLLPTSN